MASAETVDFNSPERERSKSSIDKTAESLSQDQHKWNRFGILTFESS